jgi:hypothetical protein
MQRGAIPLSATLPAATATTSESRNAASAAIALRPIIGVLVTLDGPPGVVWM